MESVMTGRVFQRYCAVVPFPQLGFGNLQYSAQKVLGVSVLFLSSASATADASIFLGPILIPSTTHTYTYIHITSLVYVVPFQLPRNSKQPKILCLCPYNGEFTSYRILQLNSQVCLACRNKHLSTRIPVKILEKIFKSAI